MIVKLSGLVVPVKSPEKLWKTKPPVGVTSSVTSEPAFLKPGVVFHVPAPGGLTFRVRSNCCW